MQPRLNAAAVCLLIMLIPFPSQGQQVKFFEGSFKEALARAKEQQKLVCLFTYTEPCERCDIQRVHCFSNRDVAEMLEKDFIPLQRNLRRGEGVLFAMKYRTDRHAESLVFDSDGRLLIRFTGPWGAEGFLRELPRRLEHNVIKNRPGISPSMELEYPQFLRNAIEGISWPTPSTVEQYLAEHPDWSEEVTWSAVTLLVQGEQVDRYILDNYQKLSRLYGKDEMERRAVAVIERRLGTALTNRSLQEGEAALKTLKVILPGYWPSYRGLFYHDFYVAVRNFQELKEVLDDDSYKGEFITPAQPQMLNNAAWTIYEHCDDSEVLMWAVDVMREVIEKNALYAYVDTYAALLYKTGQYEEAEKPARHAIEIGTRSGEDTAGTEALLRLIREKL